jgi:PPOX class probable F420-dependent enzyme
MPRPSPLAETTAAGRAPGPAGRAADRLTPADAVVLGTIALSAVFLLVFGIWALGWPAGFADYVRFPEHEHFVHDVGAFQIGLGAGLALALLWRDARATVLAGFLVANTVHAWTHAIDGDLGGRDSDAWLLGGLSLLVAVALWLRLRQLGYVVGPVRPATTPALVPFVEQKTVAITTHRRDGTPVATPVSLAVDGDRAVMRSFEKAGKTKRLRRDPTASVTPSTGRGTPTGPAIPVRLRRLDGEESRRAARLLRRKHPLLHGVLVPLTHRLGRARTGRTVHFEVLPVPSADAGTGASR